MLKWLSVFAGIGVIVLGTGALAHEIKHKGTSKNAPGHPCVNQIRLTVPTMQA